MERNQQEISNKIDIDKVGKIILIDWGYFLHSSIFAWKVSNRQIAPTYTAMAMIIASLKRVGVDPDDLMILCVDGRNNWRKSIDPAYKGNRKDKKDQDDFSWQEMYDLFDSLLEELRESSPFQQIKIDRLEADDIIAVTCQRYKEKKCIIISVDSDFDQLYAYPNVRMYSPKRKAYKTVDNPYAILASKIKKESTDNLVTEIVTDEDYQRRKMIVNLIELPDFVKKLVVDRLDNLVYNDYDLKKLPFGKSFKKRFMEIYNSNCIVDINKEPKSKVKRKTKKCTQSKEKASKVTCLNLLTISKSQHGSS